jgi:hypothetical protein
MPAISSAQDDARIANSMASLKAMAAKSGAPKLEGKEAVSDKDAPALYFGSTKINNNFDYARNEYECVYYPDFQICFMHITTAGCRFSCRRRRAN